MTYPVQSRGVAPPAVTTEPKETTPNVRYVLEGLYRTLEQFKGKPRFSALLSIYLEAVQELETVLFSVFATLDLTTVTGASLDRAGRVLNYPRGSLTDEEYRQRLRVQMLVLRSSGTGAQMITILQTLLGAATFSLREFASAFEVVADTSTVPGATIAEILRRAKAAGIALFVADSLSTGFLFSSSDGVFSTRGFGPATGIPMGGRLAGVYQ